MLPSFERLLMMLKLPALKTLELYIIQEEKINTIMLFIGTTNDYYILIDCVKANVHHFHRYRIIVSA